ENGESKGRAALEVVKDWGPELAELPLVEQRDAVKSELYDLLLLMAQIRGRRASNATAGRDMMALLDRAAPLRTSSASYHRLRAQGHQLLGEKEKAVQEQRRADDPRTPSTALDHYLLGMQYQLDAVRPADEQTEADAVKTVRQQLVQKAIEQYRRALRGEPDAQ